MRTLRACFSMGVVAAVALASAALAQMPTYAQAGPVPPALAAAKTVFVSNAGSDSGLFPQPFTGDPDRPYTQFYAALKATGDYTLAVDAAKADLVLEIRLTNPYPPYPTQGSIANFTPMFRLVVYDGKTHYVLWAFTQTIEFAVGQKPHDKNFDAALGRLLNQFLQISGKQPVAY